MGNCLSHGTLHFFWQYVWKWWAAVECKYGSCFYFVQIGNLNIEGLENRLFGLSHSQGMIRSGND